VLELRRTSVSNELRYVVRCRDDSLFSAIASQRELLLHRKTSPLQWRAYFIYQKRASFFIISDSLSSCAFKKSSSPMKTVALCPQCNGSSINTNRDGRCVASEGTLSASSSTIITQTHILSAWAAPPRLLPPPPPLWSILTLFFCLYTVFVPPLCITAKYTPFVDVAGLGNEKLILHVRQRREPPLLSFFLFFSVFCLQTWTESEKRKRRSSGKLTQWHRLNQCRVFFWRKAGGKRKQFLCLIA